MLRNELGLMRIHRRVENPLNPGHVESAVLGVGMVSVHRYRKNCQCRHQAGGEPPLRPLTHALCRC